MASEAPARVSEVFFFSNTTSSAFWSLSLSNFYEANFREIYLANILLVISW